MKRYCNSCFVVVLIIVIEHEVEFVAQTRWNSVIAKCCDYDNKALQPMRAFFFVHVVLFVQNFVRAKI